MNFSGKTSPQSKSPKNSKGEEKSISPKLKKKGFIDVGANSEGETEEPKQPRILIIWEVPVAPKRENHIPFVYIFAITLRLH